MNKLMTIALLTVTVTGYPAKLTGVEFRSALSTNPSNGTK